MKMYNNKLAIEKFHNVLTVLNLEKFSEPWDAFSKI